MYAMHACMHVCMCVMDVTYLMQCDAYMHVGIQALRSLRFEVHCEFFFVKTQKTKKTQCFCMFREFRTQKSQKNPMFLYVS